MDSTSRLPPLCPPFRYAIVGTSSQLQAVNQNAPPTPPPSTSNANRSLFGSFLSRSEASPRAERAEDTSDILNFLERGNAENETTVQTYAVHRGAYPTLSNFRYLRRLGLRSVVSMLPSKPPTKDLLEFCKVEGIKHVYVKTGKSSESSLAPQVVAKLVEHLITPESLPCYIHCSHGGNITGKIIMILRKLQCWSYESIIQEYERYVKDQSVSEEEKSFLVEFNYPIHIPPRVPGWLWQGATYQPHPTMELVLPHSDVVVQPATKLANAPQQLAGKQSCTFRSNHSMKVDCKPQPDFANTVGAEEGWKSELERELNDSSSSSTRLKRSGSFEAPVRSPMPQASDSDALAAEALEFMAELQKKVKRAVKECPTTVDAGVSRHLQSLCLEAPRSKNDENP